MKNLKFRIIRNFLFSGLLVVFMTSCSTISTIEPVLHLPKSDASEEQKLVIFIDGTENDEKDITNIFKLKNIITLQNRKDIKTIYIEGVGTNNKILGAMFGTGFGQDIKQAYEFLTTNYKTENNKIYLFGFSRGAYAVRILAGMIQIAGIPDLSTLSVKKRKKIVKMIYDAYSDYDGKSYDDINVVLKNQEVKLAKLLKKYSRKNNIEIEFVGIWDTVEALAAPDYKENNILEVRPKIDQLCNVKHISHALSLDDDRARVFTPIFITKNATKEQCGKPVNDRIIKQVFFSGAHSDVGGGYSDTDIDGISLNWMIGELSNYNVLPSDAGVYSDVFGKTHDPEDGIWKYLYHFQHRNISKYAAILDEKLTIHPSVIDRLSCVPQQCHEIDWMNNNNLFRHCFKERKDGTLEYEEDNPRCQIKKEEDINYINRSCTNRYEKIEHCKDTNGKFPCKLEIDASSRDNPSIELDKNSTYSFGIKITEKWSDLGICATPEQGRKISRQNISLGNKILLYSGKLVSYSLNAGYMELLGKIDTNIFSIGKLLRNNEEFSPVESGKLEVFVNEPVISDDYYKNNKGKLDLIINKK